MDFNPPLQQAILLRRYKRFLADVELVTTGEHITVHCPNTGSMDTCFEAGDVVYLSKSKSKTRKTSHSWEVTRTKTGMVGINTHFNSALVHEALQAGCIKELAGYKGVRPEATYAKGVRFDFLLSKHQSGWPDGFCEVKNATLYDTPAKAVRFPDAVTLRGQKHLRALEQVMAEGKKAFLLFVVNREGAEVFAPAHQIDPTYAKLLRRAHAKGLGVLAYPTRFALPHAMRLSKTPVPVDLSL